MFTVRIYGYDPERQREVVQEKHDFTSEDEARQCAVKAERAGTGTVTFSRNGAFPDEWRS